MFNKVSAYGFNFLGALLLKLRFETNKADSRGTGVFLRVAKVHILHSVAIGGEFKLSALEFAIDLKMADDLNSVEGY